MAKHLTIANAEVTTISLADYRRSVYDDDLEMISAFQKMHSGSESS